MKPTELMRPSLRLRIEELERTLRSRETGGKEKRREEKGSGSADAPGPAAACTLR